MRTRLVVRVAHTYSTGAAGRTCQLSVQQAADGEEGLQVDGHEEEPPPAAVDRAVAEGSGVRGQHEQERDA